MTQQVKLPRFGIRSGKRLDDLIVTARNQRWQIWRFLVEDGRYLTQEEISKETGIYAAQARVAELHQAGLIEVWDRRMNDRGREVDVWCLTNRGRVEYARIKTLFDRET